MKAAKSRIPKNQFHKNRIHKSGIIRISYDPPDPAAALPRVLALQSGNPITKIWRLN
jgi:hypothetical protein